jgi:uncharacterized lipoprotein YddW (UPF0748 family)
VDTFNPGLRNSAEVSRLVADARAGHFNALIVEVRKRGDAYYNSLFEPKAVDISPPDYDPLADLILKAHDTGTGPRLEVHAWMVAYNIWNQESALPPQPDHPYRLHPEWVTRSSTGATWDGSNYGFDPGHPSVQQHTFNVALDLVSRYDIDGLHLDYIRYAGKEWGYHPVSLDRFRALYGRTGTPDATDAQWQQFRRDQVTELVRKIYLNAIARKPPIKISAATITWAPGITTDAQWPGSAAYSHVLQDWRAWMEEGILDLNVPMAYFRHTTHPWDWSNWSQFAKDHRYQRHVALGTGVFINSIAHSILQFRSTRDPSPTGNVADGLCAYSYAATSNDGLPRSTFLDALTQPSSFDPQPTPIFPTPVNPPLMPWKSAPTTGHLAGYVTESGTGEGLDGVVIELTGPRMRMLRSDGTGFYGAVDLPPGAYLLTASLNGFEPGSVAVDILPGEVAFVDLELLFLNGIELFHDLRLAAGRTSAILQWTTREPAVSWIEFGPTSDLGLATPALAPEIGHDRMLSGLDPDTQYFYRLMAEVSGRPYRSPQHAFRTAGESILDNPLASYTGSWSLGTSATDKYSTNYRYAGTVSGLPTATATFRPNLATAGRYDIYAWHPQGGNRSTLAPFLISDRDGSLTVLMDQTTGGGAWQLIAANRSFGVGSNGSVQLLNNTGESSRIVLADAVRFVYAPNQDPPPSGATPDWWTEFYFGAGMDGQLDPDGDGYSNHAEFVCGTNPQDPSSLLELRIDSSSPGVRQVVFSPFHAGRIYLLERRGELTSTAWTALTDFAPVGIGQLKAVITDTETVSGPLFYRLRVGLPPESP